jgi:hypothetical protein
MKESQLPVLEDELEKRLLKHFAGAFCPYYRVLGNVFIGRDRNGEEACRIQYS